MVEAQKEKNEFENVTNQFVSDQMQSAFNKLGIRVEVREFDNGTFKTFIIPTKEGMNDKEIADNFKKGLIEAGSLEKEQDIRKFNMLMGTLVDNANQSTIKKIQGANQDSLRKEFNNFLKNANVKLGDASAQGEGQGKGDAARSVSLMSQDEFNQILLNSAKLVDPKDLTEEQRKEIKERMEDSIYVDEQNQTWIMLSVSSKTEGFYIKVPHNEEIENIITGGIETQLARIKENPDILKEQLGDKNPFYTDENGNLMVRYKNFKGEEVNRILMDVNGKVDKDAFKELMYVYNIVENTSSAAGKEFNRIRDINKISVDDSKVIRGFLMEGISEEQMQKLNEFYQPAVDSYAEQNKNKMTMDTDALILGHYYAINEKKEEKTKDLGLGEYRGMGGTGVGFKGVGFEDLRL